MVTLVLLGDTVASFAMQLLIRMGTRNGVENGEVKEAVGRACGGGGWLSSPNSILREAYGT